MNSNSFESLAFVVIWILVSLILIYFDFTRFIGTVLLLILILPIAAIFIWDQFEKYRLQRDAEARVRAYQDKLKIERPVVSGSQVDQQKIQKIQLHRLAASKRAKVENILKTHIGDLVRQRSILIKKSNYGLLDNSEWLKEIQFFNSKILLPAIGSISISDALFGTNFESIDEFIDDYVKREADRINEELQFSNSMTPIEFENFCANQLSLSGWLCKTTKASGDQGADVLAEIEISDSKWRIVVQCKLYSSPVGNKAVQEAYSAKSHYGANFAVVVSNNEFTPAARELAQTTNVQLWHYSDLRNSLQKLGLSNNDQYERSSNLKSADVGNSKKSNIQVIDEDDVEIARKIVIGCIDYELKNHNSSIKLLEALKGNESNGDDVSNLADKFAKEVIFPSVTSHDLYLLDEGNGTSMIPQMIIERAKLLIKEITQS